MAIDPHRVVFEFEQPSLSVDLATGQLQLVDVSIIGCQTKIDIILGLKTDSRPSHIATRTPNAAQYIFYFCFALHQRISIRKNRACGLVV